VFHGKDIKKTRRRYEATNLSAECFYPKKKKRPLAYPDFFTGAFTSGFELLIVSLL